MNKYSEDFVSRILEHLPIGRKRTVIRGKLGGRYRKMFHGSRKGYSNNLKPDNTWRDVLSHSDQGNAD